MEKPNAVPLDLDAIDGYFSKRKSVYRDPPPTRPPA